MANDFVLLFQWKNEQSREFRETSFTDIVSHKKCTWIAKINILIRALFVLFGF